MQLLIPKCFPPSLFCSFAVCKCLQGLISALTQGGEGVHLFRLTCSTVLLGGRDTANKYYWHVWGSQWMGYTGFAQTRIGMHFLGPHSVSRGALQDFCPKWALHFPALSRSKTFRVSGARKGTLGWVVHLCPSQVRAAQMTGCLVSTPSQVGQKSYSPSQLPPLGFLVHHKSTAPGVLCVPLGADLLAFQLWLSLAYLSASGEEGPLWLAML